MSNKLRSIKVVITGLFLVVAVAFLVCGTAVAPTEASSGGAPTGRTGAPGESTCTACHDQTAATGQFNISAPINYVPGQTYTIQVQHTTSDASRAAWGFELIPLTATNAMAGSLAVTNSSTRIRTSGTKSYMTHTDPGTFPGQHMSATWSFSWTAPTTNVGPVTLYGAGLAADNSGDETGDQTLTRSVVINPTTPVVIHHGFSDFDGDGKADISVFRQSFGIWYLNTSSSGFAGIQWGVAADKLTPADFDGDDKTDIAVWRAAGEESSFFVLQSATQTVRVDKFGITGDESLVVGDWDGDGKADPAVFRDSAFGAQGCFFYRGSLNNPAGNITFLLWGTTGDKAVGGDFDGDGIRDAAVFRPSNNIWYIRLSSNGQIRYDYWGMSTDRMVPADYDGDGKADLAAYRSGIWYIKPSATAQPLYYLHGLETDLPVPADYDGDGKTDVAVYRSGMWYIRLSSTGTVSIQPFGAADDVPVPSAFVR